MAKLTRTILTIFACAVFCSLSVAATAWANGTGPIDENGKWVPGTYEGGTGTVSDAHPGKTCSASVTLSAPTPESGTYYSLGKSVIWYLSEDGQTGWTEISANLSTAIPDVFDPDYEFMVGRYLKAKVCHEYRMNSLYTSTGEIESLVYEAETEPAYISPHQNTDNTWKTDKTCHWRPCTSNAGGVCSYQIDLGSCDLVPGSDTWSVDEYHHWNSCSTCGGQYRSEKHCFDNYIATYIKNNPASIIGPTVHPTCDICKQVVTMPTDFFMSQYVMSPILGDNPEDGDEPVDDAENGTTDPEEDATISEGEADAEDESAQTGSQTKADASQATFARTGDATPAYLIGAFALMAGAAALFARKRMKA